MRLESDDIMAVKLTLQQWETPRIDSVFSTATAPNDTVDTFTSTGAPQRTVLKRVPGKIEDLMFL